MSVRSSTTTVATAFVAATLAAVVSAGITYHITKKQGRDDDPDDDESAALKRLRNRNNLDPEMQKIGRAKVERKAVSLARTDRPQETHVVRIVLTGGPCAGKSSALVHLREKATSLGFDVYCAPEVATLLFNSGVVYPPVDDAVQVLAFQGSVVRLQLILERNITEIVAKTGRPSIIIYDRGLLDAKGYMTLDMWADVLSRLYSGRDGVTGVTEEYCLQRYDGVIHLVTAADGAEQYYKSGIVTDDSGNTVVRREGLEEARELDRKMTECWKNHPRHYVMKNVGTFQDKLELATRAVIELAEQCHPEEAAKAKNLRHSPSIG